MTEQFLEYVWLSKLSTCGCPLERMLGILLRNITIHLLALFGRRVLSNIDSIVNQAHAIVCSLVLKRITISQTETHNKRNDLRCCIRDFDRVRFDMNNLKSPLLNSLCQIHHKKSSSLCHDVILVSRIMESIVKFGRSQSINRIDCSL